MLREFGEYAQGKGRLRVFRTEAVRAGVKRAWAELMYYNNALLRAEARPAQGRLL